MGELIDSIVNISISRRTATPTRQSLTNPLICGSAQRFPEYVRTYTQLTGMSSDGFLTTDPEYLAAAAIKSQNPSLKKWKVGRRSTSVTSESYTLQVKYPLAIGEKFDFFVDGVEVIATSVTSSVTSMAATLAALMTSGKISTCNSTSSGDTVTNTRVVAGTYGRVQSWPRRLLKYKNTSSLIAGTLTTDLNAIQALDADWYGLVLVQQSKAEVTEAANWAEAADPKVLFVFDQSDDQNTDQTITNDIFSNLKAASLTKTAGIQNANDTQSFLGAAWMGRVFAMANPGAANWNFKTLSGPLADGLSSNETNALIGKNANFYVVLGGLNLTQGAGKVASGEYIDVIQGLDALALDMALRIFTDLANNAKLPYTDTGMDVIRADISASLSKFSGPQYLLLIPGSTNIEIPLVADMDPADKANRVVNGIVWGAKLQGAVNAVNIAGTVSL